MSRTLILLLALDHLALAVLTLGNCKPGEYISSAAWSLKLSGKRRGHVSVAFIDGLFYFVQKDHCAQSWLYQRSLCPT